MRTLGGGILAAAALKLVHSAVVGNGGAYYGGGIEAFGGRLTLLGSRVSRNETTAGVGAGSTRRHPGANRALHGDAQRCGERRWRRNPK